MEEFKIVDDYDFKDLNQAFAAVNWYKKFELTKRGSYQFDLNRLRLNYWYKNWKEVCNDLGIKYEVGRILKDQQKIVESNTEFLKDGRKYLFKSVPQNIVTSTLDPMTTVTRADCVEVLLLSIFSETKDHPIALTAKGWYKLLGMSNDEWKSPSDIKGVINLSKDVEKNELKWTGEWDKRAPGEKIIISEHSDVSTSFFVRKTMDEFSYALKYGINNLIDRGAVSVDFVYGGYPIDGEDFYNFVRSAPSPFLFGDPTGEMTEEEYEMSVPECVNQNVYKIEDCGVISRYPMKMFDAEENVALLKYKRAAMDMVGVERESETYRDRALRQRYYNIVNYLVLKNLHYIIPARFMVAYPYSKHCVNVLKTMTEREDIKALLNRKVKNGLVNSANRKKDRASYISIYNTDQFVRAINYLMKETMSHDEKNTNGTIWLGLANGQAFSSKDPDYRRIGQTIERNIEG